MTHDAKPLTAGAPIGARGFTLIELMVVVAIFGVTLAFGVPSYLRFNQSLQLKSASQNIAGQLQLAREKAIATGANQTMHLYYGTFGVDYHIHNPGQLPITLGKLPKQVTYLWSAGTLPGQQVVMQANGRANQSGMVILQDNRGLRDTVVVQLSGLVVVQ